MNATQILSRNLDIKIIKTEKIKTRCSLCGNNIADATKLKNIVSDNFTNYEYLKFKTDYICEDCAKCIKDDKLRKNNFLADKDRLILFKQNEIEKYIFQLEKYVLTPFVFAITRSFKKHNSFKCDLNYDYKHFYIQEEDKKYLFEVEKMKKLYEVLNDAYLYFTKDELLAGNYRTMNIEKYGINNYIELEKKLKQQRNTHQFELLIYMLNSEQRNEYIKKKKEEEKDWKKQKKLKNVQ